jgi:hypothetical protein
MARPRHDPHRQTPTQITRNQQGPPTYGTEKHTGQSTKITADLDLATSLDIIPSQEPNNPRTNVVFVAILTEAELRKSYSDQTSKFPVQSSCAGYNYVMILYMMIMTATSSFPNPSKLAKPAS